MFYPHTQMVQCLIMLLSSYMEYSLEILLASG